MSDLSVMLRIKADGKGAEPALAGVRDRVKEVGVEVGKTNDRLRDASGRFVRVSEAADQAAGGIQRAGRANSGTLADLAKGTRLWQEFGPILKGLGFIEIARQIIVAGNALNGMQAALTAATGSSEQAAEEIAFVRAEAQRLGIDLQAAAKSYTGLAAAAKGTNLEGRASREIFSAVAEAGRVMNLSAVETQGALTAVQQIISKGTVSAEELRGQLGERLPGAFQVAARAMGVTTAELGKMLEAGELTAEEFLPKFAAELRNVSSAGLEAARNSPAAEFTRLKNAVFELAGAIAQSGLLDLLGEVARNLADLIKISSDAVKALTALREGIQTLERAQAESDERQRQWAETSRLAADAARKQAETQTRGLATVRAELLTNQRALERVVRVQGEESKLAQELIARRKLLLAELQRSTKANQDSAKATTAAAAATGEAGARAAYAAPRIEDFASAVGECAREAVEAADPLADFNSRIDQIVRSVGDMRVDQVSADMAQLQIAIDDAMSQGNVERADELRAALEALGDEFADVPDLAASAGEAARAFEDNWRGAVDAVTDAFSDFVAGNIRSFRDFGRALESIARQFLANLVRQFLATNLQVGGVSIPGAGGMGGGGFGGGGLSSAIPALAAAAGGIYGFTNRGGSNGSGGSLAGAAAYAGLGYVGGTIALGAGLGASAGAAGAAGALGGAVSGGLGAAAAIPVIGWIAAIAALVDLISGGKLFGTRFRPESSTTTIGLGEMGGTADASLREVRQRSLFRGRQWRSRSIDPGDEARAAAEELFLSVGSVMENAARSLAIDTPPMIDAAIRTVVEYDKKGKVKATKTFVDVIGRTWEEASSELAATRLSAEAIVATIDAALGGVASEVAERWRGDAEELMDGARLLLAASVDIRQGASILGESATLAQVVDLVEEMAIAGESLVDTYARLVVTTNMLDTAVRLLGAELDMGREEFVRFAADIADAAGGLDEANALWNDFFQRFFSPEERAQLALDQAAKNRDEQLAALGLSSNTSVQEFRELFQEALPTLSAEAVVQWLRAGRAIGAVIDAEEALSEARAAGAAVARDAAGIERLLADLEFEDALAGMTSLEQQIARLTRQFDDYIAQAIEMGATEEEIARIRALGQRAIDRLTQAEEDRYDMIADSIRREQDYLRELAASIRDAFGWVREALNEEQFAATSTLTPQQRFEEAQAQFQQLLVRARSGDLDAARELQGAYQRLLEEGLSYLGGGDQYRALREAARASLEPLMLLGEASNASMQDVLNRLTQALLRFTQYLDGQGGTGPVSNATFGPPANSAFYASQVVPLFGGATDTGARPPANGSRGLAGDEGPVVAELRTLNTRMERVERAMATAGDKVSESIVRAGVKGRFG